MDNDNPIIRIGDSLRKLNQTFFQLTRCEAECCGVTPIQFLVLRILRTYPQISLNEVADHMHSGASTASGVVERLVQAGFILRERPETDRRSVVLRLSPAGEKLVEKTNELIMNKLSPLLRLTDEEVAQLLRLHGKIIDLLQNAREEK